MATTLGIVINGITEEGFKGALINMEVYDYLMRKKAIGHAIHIEMTEKVIFHYNISTHFLKILSGIEERCSLEDAKEVAKQLLKLGAENVTLSYENETYNIKDEF